MTIQSERPHTFVEVTGVRSPHAACIAILASLFLSVPTQSIAATVSPEPDPPPVVTGLGQGAYDLITGSYTYSATEVVIGQPGSGGLAFTRTFFGSGWRDNYAGTINAPCATTPTTGCVYTVSTGQTSETFTYSAGGTYDTDQGIGSTLTYDNLTKLYTYTMREGTVAIFDQTLKDRGGVYDANVARITTLTQPSGERTTWHYTCTGSGSPCTGSGLLGIRLQSVTNNLGYQIHFTYWRDTAPTTQAELDKWRGIHIAIGINMAIDYCDPTANTCPAFTFAYPSATYSDPTAVSAYSTVTDNLSRVWQYSGSANGLIGIRFPSYTSGNDNIIISYDLVSGRIHTVTNSAGATWTYSFATVSTHWQTTITDPLSNNRIVTSDYALLQMLSDDAGTGHATSYTYDNINPYHRLTRVTLPEGNYTEYTYDGRGNVTQTDVHPKSGSGLSTITTSAAFDSTCSNPVTCNQPNSTTDARGFRTDYTYASTHGGVLTVTQPAPSGSTPVGSGTHPQTRYDYTALYAYYYNGGGSPVAAPTSVYRLTQSSACATSAWVSGACVAGSSDETRTTPTYGTYASTGGTNLLPTQIATGAPSGGLIATTAITYTEAGDVNSVTDPVSNTTQFWYDSDRERVGVVGPDPDGGGALLNRAVRYSYNANGQITSVEHGTTPGQTSGNWSSFSALLTQNTTYNGLNQPVTQTLVGGGSIQQMVQYEYDAAGRLLCTAQRINPAYFSAPNTAGCTLTLVAQNLGPDRITRNTYDGGGRTTQVMTGYGSIDQANASTVTYTNNGQVATLTDANSNVTNYVYDGVDRLSCIRYSGSTCSSTNDYEEYTYDPASNVTGDRRRDSATITNTYDNLNRLTQMAPGASPSTGPTISYTYDNFGRRLTASQPGSAGDLTFTYDQLSRNLTQTSKIGGTDRTVTYQYDLAGRRTQMTWPDSFYVTYAYNNANDLTGILENGSTSLAAYTYDNLGRETLLTRDGSSNTTETPSYDNASNLSQLIQNLPSTSYDQTIDLSHNNAGQISARTGSNASYEWSPSASGTTNYTPNGLNQYSAVGGASFTYDARGNLTSDGTHSFSYDIYNRLLSGPSSAALSYDAGGRLYETNQGTSATTTRFLYDGASIIAEYDDSNPGVVLRRFVHGPSGPMVWYEGSGTSTHRWLIPDERGSIIARDNAGSVSVNTYDEYGQNGSSNAGRFQYVGLPWIGEAGVYQMGARNYAPGIGRWMQTDPILTAGGINLYAYVANDPLNQVDPSGLAEWRKDKNGKFWLDACEGPGCDDEVVVNGGRGWAPPGGLTNGEDYFGGTGNHPTPWGAIERGAQGEASLTGSAAPARCISPTDGPVDYKGLGVDLVMVGGVGFGVYSFDIPSTGAHGFVSSGAGLLGFGGSAAFNAGRVNNFGNFTGRGYRLSADVVVAGIDYYFANGGEHLLTGVGLSIGGGGGLYGGRTITNVLSSNRPVCG